MSVGLFDLSSKCRLARSPTAHTNILIKEGRKRSNSGFSGLWTFFSCLKVWSGTGNSRMSPIELMKAKISRCFFRPKGSMRVNSTTLPREKVLEQSCNKGSKAGGRSLQNFLWKSLIGLWFEPGATGRKAWTLPYMLYGHPATGYLKTIFVQIRWYNLRWPP